MNHSYHCGSVKRVQELRGRIDMKNEIINLTLNKYRNKIMLQDYKSIENKMIKN